MAVSTASEPDEVKKIRESGTGAAAATNAAKRSTVSLVKMSNVL
ncbi:unannotated protein [freshwater metagenome]|uniref:Unannotated protein n=1 Tax=freshwater metagenome TaxID=449393 RepID=A0A6J6I9Y1_9ZZZZ